MEKVKRERMMIRDGEENKNYGMEINEGYEKKKKREEIEREGKVKGINRYKLEKIKGRLEC